MPGSFLSRHRTICEVLEEIRAVGTGDHPSADHIAELVDEAKLYAQRMSARLVEYKIATLAADTGLVTEDTNIARLGNNPVPLAPEEE